MAAQTRTDRPPLRFFLRWGAAVGVSVIIASLILYGLTSRGLKQRILQESLRGYGAQAERLEPLLAASRPSAPVQATLGSRLDWMSHEYGTVYVELSDGSGKQLAASGTPATPTDLAQLRAVATSGRPASPDHATTVHGGPDRYVFLLPVRSPAGTLVLRADEQARIVDDLVRDLRIRQVRSLLLVILMAVPISYLLGGRGLHRRQRAAERSADTDALTGIYGRRRFESILNDALGSPANSCVALALVDIDNFKRVNDRFGHSHGDQVLIALARSFQALREGDVAFRMGGDEFAAVLPRADEERAGHVLERVRNAMTKAWPDITISCGIASVGPRDRVSQNELRERADLALYEAKRLGGHQSVNFSTVASARSGDEGTNVKAEGKMISRVPINGSGGP